MSSDRPIFVIGCPRSGTTLLTVMLSSHSRIALPPETRFLLPVFRARRSFGDLGTTSHRRRLARQVVRRRGTKFAHLGLDPERVKRAVVTGPPTIGSALSVPYRLYATDRGKARWGDKRPSYFRNIALLRALFPDAQIVHLVRDPRDAVASLKRMRWWRHGVPSAVATWAHAMDCARVARRRLPADAFYQLRYEDLVTDPRAELTLLCTFLGEEFEQAMLAPQVEAAKLPRRQRAGWHAETQGAVGTRRVGTYVEVLTPEELALVEWATRSRLPSARYAQAPAGGAAKVPPALRGRYLKALTAMRIKTALLARRDARLAHPAGSVAARP